MFPISDISLFDSYASMLLEPFSPKILSNLFTL